MTESEMLFERFALQTKLRINRVPTADHSRRPDYIVRASIRRARRVVIEVKEFQPNAEEAAAIEKGRTRSFYDMPSIMPGERIRRAIDDARPQLRALSKGKYPAILILRDNVLGDSLHTDPYSVLTAMRGLDVVPVEIPKDPNESPIFGNARPGGRKRMTANHNTSISALGLLKTYSRRAVSLHVYHNRFAAVPLRVSDLPLRGVIHMSMKRDESGWFRHPAV